MYVSELDGGRQLTVPLGRRRQAYMACIEGRLTVNGTAMAAHDGLQATGSHAEASRLEMTAGEGGAHFMLIEMMKPGRTEL